MNFIPSSFDEHQIKRTVIGGTLDSNEPKMNMSVILLNSVGNQLKTSLFENLVKCKFSSIISIENNASNYNLDELTKVFPSIKFIVPLEPTTDGELINLAMGEIKSDYAIVIRDTLNIPSGFILSNLAEKLTSEGIYCVVPWLSDKNKQGLPIHFTPAAEKSHFVIESSLKVSDGLKSVYPFDYIGIYNRKKFIQLGGYDYTIKSPYWQNLDLAVRSWLWGEETKLTTILQLSYQDEVPVEDSTINLDYLRYYLKNEAPKMKNEKAILPKTFFHKFHKRSSCGYLEAKRQFKIVQQWIDKNKFNFKQDLQNFIQNWNNENND